MRRRNLTLLIKPASGRCNMRCLYCFYADEAMNRDMPDHGLMGLETAHSLIDKAFEEAEEVAFAFQGGEPAVRGLGFFRDFVSYARRKGRSSFSLQTNGMLIDEEWADFFRSERFLIGLSMDGRRPVHDLYRRGADGKGTFRAVHSHLMLLRKKGVDVNILVTLTKDAAMNGEDTYRYLKGQGFRWQQYIPCIDPLEASRGTSSYSLDTDTFSSFLCSVFDLYFDDWRRGDFTSVRYFDNLVLIASGLEPESCGMLGYCPSNYVVEADGEVYPCDFYVLDGYRLGNISTSSFSEFDERRKALGFTEKSLKVEEACKECRFFPLCRGGCRRDREDFSSGELGLTYLCPAYKRFFSYAWERLLYMGAEERKAREEAIGQKQSKNLD